MIFAPLQRACVKLLSSGLHIYAHSKGLTWKRTSLYVEALPRYVRINVDRWSPYTAGSVESVAVGPDAVLLCLSLPLWYIIWIDWIAVIRVTRTRCFAPSISPRLLSLFPY